MKNGLAIFGIAGLVIAFLIMIILMVKEVRTYVQKNPRSSNGQNQATGTINLGENYVTEAKRTKAQSDMQSISANLEAYRMTQGSYPNTSSYAEMVSMLIGRGIIEKEPTKPEGDYHYLYCSFDGTGYIVTAMFGAETIVSRGNDSCQPGE